jgi:hypothetical protein
MGLDLSCPVYFIDSSKLRFNVYSLSNYVAKINDEAVNVRSISTYRKMPPVTYSHHVQKYVFSLHKVYFLV